MRRLWQVIALVTALLHAGGAAAGARAATLADEAPADSAAVAGADEAAAGGRAPSVAARASSIDVCAERGLTTEIVISPLSPLRLAAGSGALDSPCARAPSGALGGGWPASRSLVLVRCSGSGAVAASGETVSDPALLIVVRRAVPQWRQ
jgi:hypothetical protein